MQVRGDRAPSNAFTLEELPNKPGYALVRFYENVSEFTEEQGELTVSGYEYDEYQMELPLYDNLEADILGSYDSYLTQAKLAEAEAKTIPSLKESVEQLAEEKAALTEKVTTLEGQLEDTQVALCDVYEQVLAATTTEEA